MKLCVSVSNKQTPTVCNCPVQWERTTASAMCNMSWGRYLSARHPTGVIQGLMAQQQCGLNWHSTKTSTGVCNLLDWRGDWIFYKTSKPIFQKKMHEHSINATLSRKALDVITSREATASETSRRCPRRIHKPTHACAFFFFFFFLESLWAILFFVFTESPVQT